MTDRIKTIFICEHKREGCPYCATELADLKATTNTDAGREANSEMLLLALAELNRLFNRHGEIYTKETIDEIMQNAALTAADLKQTLLRIVRKYPDAVKEIEAMGEHYADKKNWNTAGPDCGKNFYVGESDNGSDLAQKALASAKEAIGEIDEQ